MGNVIPAYMDIETNPETREPIEIAFYMPTRKEGHREFSVKIPEQEDVAKVFLQAIHGEASSISSGVDDSEFFARFKGKGKFEFSAKLIDRVFQQLLCEVLTRDIIEASSEEWKIKITKVWRSKITEFRSGEEDGKYEFNAEMLRAAVYDGIFARAIDYVKEACQRESDEIVLLGWQLGTDKAVLDKMCINTYTDLIPGEWKQRDVMRVMKVVFPYFKNHKLQDVARRLGSECFKEAHRALPDAKTLHGVVEAAAHNVSISELYRDFADMALGLEKALNRLLASYDMVPIAVSIATSHRVKRDKMEDITYPSVLAIQAYCPSREENQRFSILVKPPEGTEIDPLYSKGITIEDVESGKPFPEAFKAFTQWLDENVGPTDRNMLYSYKWYKEDGKAFQKECDLYDVSLPDHCFVVDLSYLKTFLLSEYDYEYWEKQGKTHTAAERLSIGFDRERIEKGEDQVFYELLDHFHISRAGDRLTQEVSLYESLIPDHIPPVRFAMMRDKKTFKGRIITIANHVKVNYVAHPIFLKVETTGLEKGGEVPKGYIIKVDAYAPNKPLKNRHFVRLVNPQRSILKSATKKHGLTDKNVKDAQLWSDVAPELWWWMGDGLKAWEKVVVVSMGSFNFTKPAIEEDSRRYDISMRTDNEWFCIQNLAQSLPRVKKYNLPAMINQFREKLVDEEGKLKYQGGELIYEVFLNLIQPMSHEEVYQAILGRERRQKRQAKPIGDIIKRAQYDEVMKAKAEKVKEAEVKAVRRRARRSRKAPAKGSRRSQRLADKKNV